MKATLVYLDGRRKEVEWRGRCMVELAEVPQVRTAASIWIKPTAWYRMFGPLVKNHPDYSTPVAFEAALFREDLDMPKLRSDA